jgi:sec-independent protein translocase protein TatA
MDIGPPELIIVLVVILVLFGGSQLPKLAKNLGKAQREFKSAMDGALKDDDHKEAAPAEPAPAHDEPSTPT